MASAKAKKQSVGLVYSVQNSAWGSCNSISPNLRSAYDTLSSAFNFLRLPVCSDLAKADVQLGNGYFLSLARAVLEADILKLSVIDHNLNILPLLGALRILDPIRASKIQYYIHVYGDFTLFTDYWHSLGRELEQRPLKLLCASDRQMRLVRSFEKNMAESATDVCPFPVDSSYFQFSNSRRSQWRKKLGLKDNHFALYTGRVSLQKGVLAIINEFRKQPSNVVLGIAGLCDDVAGPSTGLRLTPGYFFQKLDETLGALPQSVRGRILILGDFKKEDLRGLYSAADSFISLSLYHDEDFGMAPAEALVSGLPCLLTDWGGYSSFAVPDTNCQLLPVSISDRGLFIDYDMVEKKWREILNERASPGRRIASGKAFAEKFSVASVAERIKTILSETPKPFGGFGWRLLAPKNSGTLKQGLYKEIYKYYVSDTPEVI